GGSVLIRVLIGYRCVLAAKAQRPQAWLHMSLRLFFVLCGTPANLRFRCFYRCLYREALCLRKAPCVLIGNCLLIRGDSLKQREYSYKGSYREPVFIGGQSTKSPSHVAHVFATFLRALWNARQSKVPLFLSLLISGGAMLLQGALRTYRDQPSYKGR